MFVPLLLSVVSCSDDPALVPDEPQQPTPQEPTAETIVDLTPAEIMALKENVYYFGYKVAGINESFTDTNASVGFSGLSNGMLGQIVACSQEDIAKELERVALHPEKTQKELEKAYTKLIEKIDKADKDVQCHLNSSIWFQKIEGNKVKDAFEDDIEEKFSTYVRPVGTPEELVHRANEWAYSKTCSRYAYFMQQSSEFYSNALLASLFYFKGAWAEPFESETDGEFIGISGTKPVKMLNKICRISYMHNDYGQWIKLDLGSENLFEIQLCLPDTDKSQAHSFCDWRYKYVDLSFPCFVFNPSHNGMLTQSFYTSLRTLSGTMKWDAEKEDFIQGDFGTLCPIFAKPIEKKLDFFSGICVEFDNTVVEGAELKPISPDTPETIINPMKFNRPFSFRIVEKTTGITIVEGDVKNID